MLYSANPVDFLEEQKTKGRFQQKDFVIGRNLETSAKSTMVLSCGAVEIQKIWAMHQKVGTIDKLLDPNFRNEKFINDNRKHLMTFLDVIVFVPNKKFLFVGK